MFKTEVTMKNPPTSKHYLRLREAVAVCLNAAGIPTVAEKIGSISLTLQGNWKPDHQWYELSDYKSRGSRSMICQLVMTQAPGGADIDNNEYVTVHGSDYHVDCSIKLQIPVKDAEYAVIVAAMQPAADDAEPTADAPVTTGIPVIDAELNGVRAGEQTVIAAPGKPYTPTQVVDMLRSILQKWTASQVEEFRTLVPDVMPLYSKARLQEAEKEAAAQPPSPREPLHGFQLTEDAFTRYPHWSSWVKDIMVAFDKGVSGKPLLKVKSGNRALTVRTGQWLVEFSDNTHEVMSPTDFAAFTKKFPPRVSAETYSMQSQTVKPDTRREVEAFQMTPEALNAYSSWPQWVKDDVITYTRTETDEVKVVMRTLSGREGSVQPNDWVIRGNVDDAVTVGPVDYFNKHFTLKATPVPQLQSPVHLDAFQITPDTMAAYPTWPAWVINRLGTITNRTNADVRISLIVTPGKHRITKSAGMSDWFVRYSDDVCCVMTHKEFQENCELSKFKTITSQQLLDVEAVQMTREFMRDWLNWPSWLRNATVNLDDNGDILLHPPVGENQTASFDDWIIHCEDGSLDVCKPDIFGKFYCVKPPTTEATK